MRETSFAWPVTDEDSVYHSPNAESTHQWYENWHQFYYDSFANGYLQIHGRSFACANQTFKLATIPKHAKVTWSIVPDSDTTGGATVDAVNGEVTAGPWSGVFVNNQWFPFQLKVKAHDRVTDCETTHLVTMLEATNSVSPPGDGSSRPFPYSKLTNAEMDEIAKPIQPQWPNGIPPDVYVDYAANAETGAGMVFFLIPGHGNETCIDCIQNSVQHAYWNWLLAEKFGVDKAKAFTDAHENLLGNPCGDKGMDLSNNLAGQDFFRQNSKDGNPTISDDEALRRLTEMARGGLLSANTLPQ